jgi:DNA-binding response OmpR family regulator
MANILIVEDEDMLASTLRAILTRAGHTVDTAPNGRAGLKQCSGSSAYDLVITDLIMPEADGIGLIQSLRTASPALQIIAISGGGRTKNFDLLRMARKLGANEGIRKPFSGETILAAVNTCIEAQNAYNLQRAHSSAPAREKSQSGDE